MPEPKDRQEVSFRLLVEQFEAEILSFANAVTGNPDEADILAQKIFARAYLALPLRSAPVSVETWLYRFVYEESVKQCRPHGFRARWSSLKEIFKAIRSIQSGTDSVQSELRQRQTLLQRLRALPPKMRILLLLTEVASRSVSELAQIAGASEDAIKNQLFKARRRLVTLIES